MSALPIAPRVIALDETKHWNLETCPHKELVESIETVYLWDNNQHTHLCELESSFCMYHVEHRAVLKDLDDTIFTADAARQIHEAVHDWLNDSDTARNIYLHVSLVDKLVDRLKAEPFRYAALPDVPVPENEEEYESYEALWEEVLEDYPCNPVI